MKKEKYMQDLNEIQNMVGQIKTINEAIQFNDDFDMEHEPADETGAEGMPTENPQVQEPDECAGGECNLNKVNPEEQGLKELEEGGELDKIREITLRGMMTLNNTPEDPKFQALLKIFNICNKAVNDSNEGEQPKN